MNKSNLINYLPIIAFVLLLISAGLVYFILWPDFQELRVLQENISHRQGELEIKEEYVANLERVKNQINQRQDEFAKISSALPKDPSVPSFFNYLDLTSSLSGLSLSNIGSFSVSQSSRIEGLRKTTFPITVVGTYSSFKRFISQIEQSARMIVVENISFSSGADDEEEEEQQRLFVFNLVLKTYSY